ncbi:unnamed protein product [Brassica napus]|nr:unnamed protein product [Brassica napus]
MCKCCSHGTFPPSCLQSSHLNICYYHQDLHRRLPARVTPLGFAATAAPSYPLRPGSCPDGRYRSRGSAPSIFGAIRRTTCTSVSPRASTRVSSGFARSGIVHHLRPGRHTHTQTLLRRSRSVGYAPVRDPANQLPCALRVYSPVDSHTCQTPWSMFQDGSNGEPTGRRPELADAKAHREARVADHD